MSSSGRLRRAIAGRLAAALAVTLAASACTGGATGSGGGASSGGGAASGSGGPERVAGGPTGSYLVPAGVDKIKHVIVIMQENRSFDSYFGTFPGADGTPARGGKPTVCMPNPATRSCVAPYPDHADVNGGGPHAAVNATADINGGLMSGFIRQAEAGRKGVRIRPTRPARIPPGRM